MDDNFLRDIPAKDLLKLTDLQVAAMVWLVQIAIYRDAVVRFFTEPVFRTPWRLVPTWASGQLAFAAYQGPDFRLGALNVVRLRGGKIAELTGFLDPAVHAFFSLPKR